MSERSEETKVDSTVLLAAAKADIDPCMTKGQVCRGAYIVSGLYYLDKHGQWTHGIDGPDNWWDTVWDATQALKAFREANAPGEGRGIPRTLDPIVGSSSEGTE